MLDLCFVVFCEGLYCMYVRVDICNNIIYDIWKQDTIFPL